jgi:drug/metabolite transporter (DMT)-like permease
LKAALIFVVMVSFTVAANLLMKLGALHVTKSGDTMDLSPMLNWRTVLGLASFGVAGLLYAVLLRWWPLNVAQSFMSAQFVVIILASSIVLREPIHLAQWLGVALIAAGIGVVGFSQR